MRLQAARRRPRTQAHLHHAMADSIYVIDAMGFAFRSFFAIQHLSTRDGRPTNAVFGFARALLRILNEEKPKYLVAVFDAPGKTFRDERYAAYKANRPETSPDLLAQFPLIDEVVEGFHIPVLRVPGVEADDVMATLAKQAVSHGLEAVICSGDKDLLQVVGDGIKIYDIYKGGEGKWYAPEDVVERYGVPPERVRDAMALIGDSIDNVPGVRGIGEKTAKKLLEQFGSLEGLYENLDQLKGKQKEKLAEDKENAFLSRELVTLKDDVDFEFDWEAAKVREPNRAQLAKLFKSLEFHTLTEEFMDEPEASEELDYQLVLTKQQLKAALTEMKRAGRFAIDTETTSTSAMKAKLVGISLSCQEGKGYYIPVGHVPEAMVLPQEGEEEGSLFGGEPVEGLERSYVLQQLKPLLSNESLGKVAHNIKYDLIVLERAGAPIAGCMFDTMLASYLTDPSGVRHNLNDVSVHYLGRKLIPISSLIGKGAKAVTFDQAPIVQARDYAVEDADIAWRLAAVFEQLLAERGLDQLMRDVEAPLTAVLARMEMAGVKIDPEVFEDLRQDIDKRLEELKTAIYEAAGEPFQINSPKQLQEVLFGKLRLTPTRRTKTGYSTDSEVLEQLAGEHELPGLILQYRALDKLRGTYVDALPKLIHPETGRIHTSFNQTIAATGRLSSSDPNLQNIPIRTEDGRRIRAGFVPENDQYRLISADYSQIELRVLAHLSQDSALLEAFQKDADIHTETAARVFGAAPGAVTPLMRRQAKAVNFGVVYGISAYGLARNLNISNSEAAAFIEQYFEKYPGVKAWQDETLKQAKEAGYVTTLLGRRRYLPELKAADANTRRAGERVAINTPVQGSAADIIKIAMVRLDKALQDTGARMLLQVHDELLVEAPAQQAEDIAALLKQTMAEAYPLAVELKVDVGIGNNWDEIH